jgi:hypothetical protein
MASYQSYNEYGYLPQQPPPAHQAHIYATSSTSPPELTSSISNTVGKVAHKWERQTTGPVKIACLKCRDKKAKCDGARPICGQVGGPWRHLLMAVCEQAAGMRVYQVEARWGEEEEGGRWATMRAELIVVPVLSCLAIMLKKLDGLLAVPDYGLSPGRSEPNDDPKNVVRTFTSRDEV